jgi:hypothetical protein
MLTVPPTVAVPPTLSLPEPSRSLRVETSPVTSTSPATVSVSPLDQLPSMREPVATVERPLTPMLASPSTPAWVTR